MYAQNRELHPPTAVNHAMSCSFTGSQNKDLVIAKANMISVYTLFSQTRAASAKGEEPLQHAQLIYRLEESLAGYIEVQRIHRQM
eukprot:gene15541-4673_t